MSDVNLKVEQRVVQMIHKAQQGVGGPPGLPGPQGPSGEGAIFDALIVSQFDTASPDGWAPLSSIFSYPEKGWLTLTPAIANCGLYKIVDVDGGLYNVVKIRIKRLAGSGWDGSVYYSTASHGYSNLHRKQIANPLPAIGEEVTLDFDMSELTAGGTDWTDNQITGIRIDLGSTVDDVFSIDWISVGRIAPSTGAGGDDNEPLLVDHLATVNHKPGTFRNLRDSLTNPLEQLTGLAFIGDSITWGRTLDDGGVYDPRTGQPTDPRDNSTSGSFVNELRRYFGQQYFDGAVQSLSNWPTSLSGESIGEFQKTIYLYTGLAPFTVNQSGDKLAFETKTTGTVLGYRHTLRDNVLVDDGGYIEVQFTMTGDRFALLYTSISAVANADYELYINDILIGQFSTWTGVVQNGARREHIFDYMRDGVVRLRLKRTSYADTQQLYLDAIEITKTLRIYNQGIIGATSYSYADRMFEVGDTVALPEVNHAIVQLGTNDRARTFPNNNQTNGVLNFQRNLKAVIDLLPGVNVTLMSSLPAENESTVTYCMTMQDIRAAIRSVAVERQLDFIDNYLLFRGYSFDDVTADGLHPNALGHRMIAKNIIAQLEDQARVDGDLTVNEQNILETLADPTVTLDPTGFVDKNNVGVSYDKVARTVTLTHTSGRIYYKWRGLLKYLTSPWTSTAHAVGASRYFLRSIDGVTIDWSTTLWTFDQLQLAVALPNHGFALREPHGVQPHECHEEDHALLGTYRVSGLGPTVGTYTLATATDAATTPGFEAGVIKDEDLRGQIAASAEGTYTTMRIAAGGVATFDTSATFPFRVTNPAVPNTSILINNPTTGAETTVATNRYVNVYELLVPVTSDVDSQKFRRLMLQPQTSYASLAAAQAEDTRGLNLGDFGTLATEMVYYTRITYYVLVGNSNTGECTIPTDGISYVVGTRVSQVNVGAVLQAATAENVITAPFDDIGAIDQQATNEEIAGKRVKKIGGLEIIYSKSGNIDVAVGTLGRTIKRGGAIASAAVRFGTAGDTGDTTLVVKNGAVTVGSITLASGVATGNLTLTNPILAVNDVLTVDCTVAATTKAKDLSITFLLDLA